MRRKQRKDDDVADDIPIVDEPLRVRVIIFKLDIAVPLFPFD
jgi:hypothetical protein